MHSAQSQSCGEGRQSFADLSVAGGKGRHLVDLLGVRSFLDDINDAIRVRQHHEV